MRDGISGGGEFGSDDARRVAALEEFMNRRYFGVGVGLGICFGAAVGTAMGNTTLGTALGISFGAALGAAFSRMKGEDLN